MPSELPLQSLPFSRQSSGELRTAHFKLRRVCCGKQQDLGEANGEVFVVGLTI